MSWIAMKFGAGIHGTQKINHKYFCELLIFPLAPPAGQSFHLVIYKYFGFDKILSKVKTFASDSALRFVLIKIN